MNRYYLHLLIMLGFSVLQSCFNKNDELVIEQQDITMRLKIETINDSNLKFGTRNVGVETKKGYYVKLQVADRPEIIIVHHKDMKKVPAREEISSILSAYKLQLSPDQKHLAILNENIDDFYKFYHFLTKGQPFRVGIYDSLYKADEKIQWNDFPKPVPLISSFLKKSKQETDFYSINEKTLWKAISENIPNNTLEYDILYLWPDCYNTNELVLSLIKNKNVELKWIEQLKEKIKNMLNNTNSTVSQKVSTIRAAMLLSDDKQLKKLALSRSIECWPGPPYIQKLYYNEFNNFSQDLQEQIMEKAKDIALNDNYTNKQVAGKLLSKYLNCEELKEISKGRYYINLRDNCK